MSVLTPVSLYGGHRVRVMWERPTGLWDIWPFRWWHKPVPIYVFIAYRQGRDQPVRICLRDGEAPFLIENPLDYDGGDFNHGPYANALRFDAESGGHTLSGLFAMLHRRATRGADEPDKSEQVVLERALDQFYAWIWGEHRRDREVIPVLRNGDTVRPVQANERADFPSTRR